MWTLSTSASRPSGDWRASVISLVPPERHAVHGLFDACAVPRTFLYDGSRRGTSHRIGCQTWMMSNDDDAPPPDEALEDQASATNAPQLRLPKTCLPVRARTGPRRMQTRQAARGAQVMLRKADDPRRAQLALGRTVDSPACRLLHDLHPGPGLSQYRSKFSFRRANLKEAPPPRDHPEDVS